MTIHSPKGFEGGLLVSGSADHSIRSNVNYLKLLVWDLLKKKISSKINVERPNEDFLFKFKDTALTNYAEDHILNQVLIFTYLPIAQNITEAIEPEERLLLLL